MTALQRLLSYPHQAVFDPSPASELAFRVKGQNQCVWTIGDELMSVTDGAAQFSYDLNEFTVGELVAQLATDGFTVDAFSAEFAGLSAKVLVEGSGTQVGSNGGQVSGFKSLEWALFGGYAKEIREARYQVGQAIRQMVVGDSEGEWLDLHAALYDQTRKSGQTDQSLATQIPAEAFRVRVNALAIEQAIFDATGKAVTIEEPFSLMFRLSESILSGADRFYDGSNIGPNLIQPSSKQPIDWSDVIPVIMRNKAAGVIMLEPISRPSSFVTGGLDGTCSVGITASYVDMCRAQGEDRLNFMSLSNESPVTKNFGVSIAIALSLPFDANECPVSASMMTYQFSGATWLYAREWGAFAWNSDIAYNDVSLSSSVNISTFEIEVWE